MRWGRTGIPTCSLSSSAPGFSRRDDEVFPTRIPLDYGSKGSESALRMAVEVSLGTGSEMHVAHVLPTAPRPP